MEINIMDLLDAAAVVFAIIFGLTTNARSSKKDVIERAVAQAKTDSKLDQIVMCTSDIKDDMAEIRREVKLLDERVTIVERKADTANARINTMLGKDTSIL